MTLAQEREAKESRFGALRKWLAQAFLHNRPHNAAEREKTEADLAMPDALTEEIVMTREAWLARCAMAYDVGLITDKRLGLMSRWLQAVLAEGHSRMADHHNKGDRTPHESQWERVEAFWHGENGELERLENRNARMFLPSTDTTYFRNTLATLENDVDGYALIQLAAIFTHPCQRCATNPRTWWTRPECCRHLPLSEAAPTSLFAQQSPTPLTIATESGLRQESEAVRHRS